MRVAIDNDMHRPCARGLMSLLGCAGEQGTATGGYGGEMVWEVTEREPRLAVAVDDSLCA